MRKVFFGFPELLIEASSISLGPGSVKTGFSVKNVTGGSRAELFRMDDGTQASHIDFDTGGTTIDYLYISNANLLRARGANQLFLSGDAGAGFVSIIGTASDLSSKTFCGGAAQDIYFTENLNDDIAGSLASTTNYRIGFGHTVSTTAEWSFSNAFFGEKFDMGRDPTTSELSLIETGKQTKRPRLNLELSYNGITEAVVTDLINRLEIYDQSAGLVILDEENLVLESYYGMHCELVNLRVSPENRKSYDVRMTLRELV